MFIVYFYHYNEMPMKTALSGLSKTPALVPVTWSRLLGRRKEGLLQAWPRASLRNRAGP